MTYRAITSDDQGLVITEHETYHEAVEAGEARSPEANSRTIPQIDESTLDDDTYESGLFWLNVNRYGWVENTDANYGAPL